MYLERLCLDGWEGERVGGCRWDGNAQTSLGAIAGWQYIIVLISATWMYYYIKRSR